MGCQIFFVISGYLGMQSIEKIREKNTTYLSFYRKKVIAIAPAYWGSLLLIASITAIMKVINTPLKLGLVLNDSIIAYVFNFFMIHGCISSCNNNTVPGGWFIGTLVLLYGITPLVYHVFTKINYNCRKFIPVIAWLISAFVIIALYILTGNNKFIENNSFVYFSALNQLCVYLLGAELFFQNHEKYNQSRAGKEIIVSILFLAVAVILFYSEWKFTFLCVHFIMGISSYCALKWLLYIESNNFSFNHKLLLFLQYIGKNSFHIYLMHFYVVWTIPSLLTPFMTKDSVIIFYVLLWIPMLIILNGLLGLSRFWTKYITDILCKCCNMIRN